MSDNRKAPAEGDGIAASIHDPLAETFPATAEGRVLFWIAVAFSSFQLITAAGLISLPSQVVRSIHVGFLLLLVFPLIAAQRRSQRDERRCASGGWASQAGPRQSFRAGVSP